MIAVRERGVPCKMDFAVNVSTITPVGLACATRTDINSAYYCLYGGHITETNLLDILYVDGINYLTLIATLAQELFHD